MKLNILIVDDTPLVANVIRRLLTEAGHKVEIRESAKSGLDTVRSVHIDLTITDFCMEGMDGLELAKKMQIDNPGARIWLYTTDPDLADSLLGREKELGLEKVIKKSEIVRALAEAELID